LNETPQARIVQSSKSAMESIDSQATYEQNNDTNDQTSCFLKTISIRRPRGSFPSYLHC
jgi:hypothetical protein